MNVYVDMDHMQEVINEHTIIQLLLTGVHQLENYSFMIILYTYNYFIIIKYINTYVYLITYTYSFVLWINFFF